MSWQIAAVYLGVWAIALYGLYRYFYRKKNISAGLRQPLPARERYLQALDTAPDDTENLKRLLLLRTLETVEMLAHCTEERTALQTLMKTGTLAEAVWQEIQEREKFLQLEIFDIEADAEVFVKGWGKQIVRGAVQLLQHKRMQEQQQQSSNGANDEKKVIEEVEQQESKSPSVSAAKPKANNNNTSSSSAPSSTPAVATSAAEMQRLERLAQKQAQLLIEEEEREKNKKALKQRQQQQKK